ncbi:putative transcription factor [Triangularia verruculosa]|uniref:Transcription factor n=1 Tax=Triangularia verruculosa TaxID=2587418 RepID=A0AAN6XIC2_9PEZI|nr:putative transcription factor [Triangularia verruculosa]
MPSQSPPHSRHMSDPNPSSSNRESGAAPDAHLLTPSPSSPAGTPTPLGSHLPTPHGSHVPPVPPVPQIVTHRQPPTAPVGLTYTGRRTHKKSRTGCAICKARKIKCDERHPSCLNCISHGVECPFLTAPPGTAIPTNLSIPNHSRARHASKTATRASRSPSSPLSPYPYPPSAPPAESDILPMLELELLHNFTSRTYLTLASDPAVRDFWRVDVVDVGLKYEFIMRAVLAISSLHLAYHQDSSERRDFYTAQGMLLHQKASREAMKFLNDDIHGNLLQVDKDAAARLFLFSMLTIYFALASPRRPQSDGSFFINETSSFPEWTFLVTGAKSLSAVLGQRGQETMLAPFLAYGGQRWRTHRAKMEESHMGEAWGPLSGLREKIVNSMKQQEGQEGAQERLATYIHAIDELELSLVVITREQNGEEEKDVLDAMLWLWGVSDSLVPLLKIPTQEAVAIFAHFCILWKHHERTWWLQGWGDHLVERAHQILDAEHREWIEWPMRVVGLGLGR